MGKILHDKRIKEIGISSRKITKILEKHPEKRPLRIFCENKPVIEAIIHEKVVKKKSGGLVGVRLKSDSDMELQKNPGGLIDGWFLVTGDNKELVTCVA